MCLRVLSKSFSNSIRLGAKTTSLGSLWVKILSPNTQPKSPSQSQLHAVSSSLVTGHGSEDIGTCPSTSSREDVENPNEVSPKSPPSYFYLLEVSGCKRNPD